MAIFHEPPASSDVTCKPEQSRDCVVGDGVGVAAADKMGSKPPVACEERENAENEKAFEMQSAGLAPCVSKLLKCHDEPHQLGLKDRHR